MNEEIIKNRIIPGSEDAPALKNHSATYWKGRIVVFGGTGGYLN